VSETSDGIVPKNVDAPIAENGDVPVGTCRCYIRI